MARPAPRHVNQFSAGGRFPNGNDSTPYDCMVACAVMDLDAATGGRIVLTTTQARARQDDQDRKGIGLHDVKVIHDRTPGAPTLSYGLKAWPTLRNRLAAQDGAIVTGYYVALGKSRASTFRGPHAIYVQRISGNPATGGQVARINDPLRSGPRDIPLGDLQRFYLSGLGGGSGWSVGSGSAGAGAGATAGTMLPGWGGLVTLPVGHVITAADIDSIMVALVAGGLFGGSDPASQAWAQASYRDVLVRTALGQPWTKALQDRLAAAAGVAAGGAADPFGIASALQGAVAGVGEIARNGILLVAILGLIIMGLWLVATAGGGRPIPVIGG